MTELIEVYANMHGDIMLAIIRCLIGMALILNEKYVHIKFKYAITIFYYGSILGCIATVCFDSSINGIALGTIVGFMISYIICKYHRTEHFVNLLLLVIYLYEMIGLMFSILDINISDYLGINGNSDIEYLTTYATIFISLILAIISYAVLYRKSKFRCAIEKRKYFWIGNYFIVGAILGMGIFPLYGPGDSQEMCIVLLNAFYDVSFFSITMLETIMLFLYREYKGKK